MSKEDEVSHLMKSSIKSDFSEIKIPKGTITEPSDIRGSDIRATELMGAAKIIAYEKPQDSGPRMGTEINNQSTKNSIQKSSICHDNSMNLRGKLWKVLCKTDVIVIEMLEEYNHNIDKIGPAFKQSIVENKKAYNRRTS